MNVKRLNESLRKQLLNKRALSFFLNCFESTELMISLAKITISYGSEVKFLPSKVTLKTSDIIDDSINNSELYR